jgi:hypothetical protein
MLQITVFPPPIRDGGRISGLCIKGDRMSEDKNLTGEQTIGRTKHAGRNIARTFRGRPFRECTW